MKWSFLFGTAPALLGLVAFVSIGCTSGEDASETSTPTPVRAESPTPTRAQSPTSTATAVPTPTPTAPISIPPQVTLDLDPSLTQDEKDYLKRALGEIFARAEADFGVPSPEITVIAYREQDAILAKRAAWEGVDPSALGQQFSCDFCAETGYGAIFLRLGPGWFDDTMYPEKHVGRAGLAGEISIAFIYDALGESKGYQDGHTPPNLVRLSGPAWLGKGATTLWQTIVTSEFLGIPFETAFEYSSQKAKSDPVSIEQMESPAGFRTSHHPYDTSLVAVELLTRDLPRGSFMKFYAAIGQGQSWQSAFPVVFEISLSDFYVKFAEHRAGLLATAPTTPASPTPPAISGTLTTSAGSPVPPGTILCASLYEDPRSCWRAVITGTSFSVTLAPGTYVLAAHLTNRTVRYYSPNGPTRDRTLAIQIDLTNTDVSGLNVTIP